MALFVRGDVWLADLDPTRGHEQQGKRPVLIFSDNRYNRGPAGLIIVLPITSTQRPIPSQVHLQPPEGGLKNPSAILCDGIRSISSSRLLAGLGSISQARLSDVADRVRMLLAL